MAYPYPAVDTAAIRNTERLTAFLSEIIEKKPVDQYFEKYPTFDFFYKKKRTMSGGDQMILPIGVGQDPNMIDATDYDEINTSGTDTTSMVLYNMRNKFSSLTISWAEMRELEGIDHKIFDRVDYKRGIIINTLAKQTNEDFFAAAQAAKKVTSLAIGVDSSGSVGSLSQATESQWASYEIDHSDTYENDGYSQFLTMWEQLKIRKSEPDVIITTPTLHTKYEAEQNVDVRYMGDGMGAMGRGASQLLFKRVPIIADADCTSDTFYFLNTMGMPYYVDSEGDSKFFEFEMPDKQLAYAAKFVHRHQLCITDRRGQGKIINVT